MLSRRKLDMWQRLLELDMTVKVIRVEDLFPPVDLDAGLLAGLDTDQLDRRIPSRENLAHPDEGDGVWDVKRHVAVHLNGIVRTNRVLALFQERDVLSDPLVAVWRSVW